MSKQIKVAPSSMAQGAFALGASLTVLALLMPPSASAQDAPPAAKEAGVDVVIVTANRREENLQSSSISLDVVGADELLDAGVTDARDLGRVAPGVLIGQAGPFTQAFVRGVGSSSANQFGDPSVTFNQDGVVIDRPNGVGPIFYDIARVEVLKGPQGTLYGRNATGGAVNVISQPPTSDFGGFVSGQYGNYDSYVLTSALNLPASETLAFRLSTQFQGRESYLEGGFPSGHYPYQRSNAGRAQMLWEPSDDFSLRLIGEAAHLVGPSSSFVLISPNEPNSDPWLAAANPVANAMITAAAPLQILPRSDDARIANDLWNVTAELEWDLGFATLTVVPAYREFDMHSVSYDGGLRLQYDELSEQTSFEARISNQADRLTWLAGVFYFDNDRTVRNFIDSNPISQRSLQVFPSIGSQSYAAFADANYALTDTFRILGGVRYTMENKTVQGVRTDLDANPTNNFILNNDRDFDELTWRLGLEYDLAQRSMLYATVATGFKSGGFYTAISPGNEFEAEHLTAYTIGVRNRFFENLLQLNVEGFYWKYEDNQQSSIGFDGLGNIAFVTRNAGNARLYGLTADVIASITPYDEVSATLEYNNTQFESFVYQAPSAVFNVNTTGCAVGPIAAGRRTVDCSGFPLPRAPEFVARFGYEHEQVLADGASVTFGAKGNYSSSKYLTVDYLPEGRVGDTFTADLNLTFRPASGDFSVTGFVNNVTDEVTYTGGSQHQQIARMFYAAIDAPRTYGVRVNVDF